jgi:hypothetical protein
LTGREWATVQVDGLVPGQPYQPSDPSCPNAPAIFKNFTVGASEAKDLGEAQLESQVFHDYPKFRRAD